MGDRLAFTIPGQPVAWMRTGGRGRNRFRPTRLDAWYQRVGLFALAARSAQRVEAPLRGCLRMRVIAVFPRPGRTALATLRSLPGAAEVYEATTAAGLRCPRLETPDCDNMAKGIADALEHAGVLHNDRELYAEEPMTLYAAPGEAPHTEVVVWRPTLDEILSDPHLRPEAP